ncbi:hypothetical protein ACX93W_21205 [Paenibacillus sp. CAU 1782]
MKSGPASNQKLLNQSLVTFRSGNTDLVAYSNTVATPLVGPKLELTKRAKPDCVSLDETITYKLTVRNDGNRATEVTLYDPLPEGTAFVKNSLLVDGAPLPGVKPGSGIPLGLIQPGTQVRIAFQLLVVCLPPGLKIVNQAHADYIFYTLDGREISGTVWSNKEKVQVLDHSFSAHLKACTEYTFVGDVVSFTVKIVNRGISKMKKTIVKLKLPPEGELIAESITIDDVCIPSEDTVDGIYVGTIHPGSTVLIHFRVKTIGVPKPPKLRVQGIVCCRINDHSYEEETNKVKIEVIAPGITLAKTADAAAATRGDTLIYELRADNQSLYAVDATVRDCLPPGTLFVWDSVKIDGEPVRGVQPSEGIHLGTLRARSSSIITFAVSIPASALSGTESVLINKGKLSYTYRLPDGRLVRESVVSNTVKTELLAPLLSLHAAVSPTVIEPRGNIRFQLELRNDGNLPADVSLAELVPSQLCLIRDSMRIDGADAYQWDGERLLLGLVPTGKIIRIRYAAKVDEGKEPDVIRGVVLARYSYQVNGKLYKEEIRSNGYKITVEDHYE